MADASSDADILDKRADQLRRALRHYARALREDRYSPAPRWYGEQVAATRGLVALWRALRNGAKALRREAPAAGPCRCTSMHCWRAHE